MTKNIYEEDLIPEGLNFNKARIKVIGVGGGGGNAVSRMHEEGIKNVEFLICNTDHQTLTSSPILDKLQLGTVLTRGLGAGCDPEKGEMLLSSQLKRSKK